MASPASSPVSESTAPPGAGGERSAPTIYRKPPEICRPADRAATGAESFTAEAIERSVARLGLRLRDAVPDDLDRLLRIQKEWFRPPPARRINAYELHRLVGFGRVALLETAAGEIVGFDLAADYAGEPGTAGSAGLAVDPAYTGRGLGTLLMRHSMLRSMAAGAAARRGIVHPENLPSLVTLLNHLGAVCDGFFRRFGDWGQPRLTHCCHLRPEVLREDRVDRGRLTHFLCSGRRGEDYRLLLPRDEDALDLLYRQGRFLVAAVVPPACGVPEAALLALPRERLTREAPGPGS